MYKSIRNGSWIIVILCIAIFIAACGGGSEFIGKWKAEDGTIVTIRKDGKDYIWEVDDRKAIATYQDGKLTWSNGFMDIKAKINSDGTMSVFGDGKEEKLNKVKN